MGCGRRVATTVANAVAAATTTCSSLDLTLDVVQRLGDGRIGSEDVVRVAIDRGRADTSEIFLGFRAGFVTVPLGISHHLTNLFTAETVTDFHPCSVQVTLLDESHPPGTDGIDDVRHDGHPFETCLGRAKIVLVFFHQRSEVTIPQVIKGQLASSTNN